MDFSLDFKNDKFALVRGTALRSDRYVGSIHTVRGLAWFASPRTDEESAREDGDRLGQSHNPFDAAKLVMDHAYPPKVRVSLPPEKPAPPALGVYLRLFHGRKTIDEEMEDWGEQGPVLGPFKYVHTTYASDVKFETAGGEESNFYVISDCIYYGGMYYGDWSVHGAEHLGTDVPELLDLDKARRPEKPAKESTAKEDARFAEISWSAGDVQSLCPSMTDGEAEAFLGSYSSQITEDTVQRGWDSLRTLLAEKGHEIQEDA